jgi:signal transduction histidine kinase
MEAPLELLVRATEFEIDGRKFALFAAQDVSHEKRRLSLERIFFHDILNTVGGLRGVSEILKEEADGPLKEIAEVVYDTTHALVNEIQAQRNLLAAETGDLLVTPAALNTRHFLDELVVRYRRNEAFQDRHIYVDPNSAELQMVTDPTLLGRVLGNLIKNALEAVKAGETVTVGCRAEDGRVEFRVHNPGVMPRDVQLQMFKRSFSTKGQGHGLGTYSVKLLTENYLAGKVDFMSTPEDGTTFRVAYPLSIEPK